MQGSGVYVRDVHGHLRDAVFVYVPAYGLGALERAGYPALSGRVLAALLAHVKSHGVGAARGGGVQVEVHRYQEVPGPHVGGAGLGHGLVPGAAKVRLAGRVGHFFRKRLVFSLPAHGQVPALRRKCRSFIAVAGDAQLLPQPFGQFPGQGGTLFQRNAGHRNQGQHVRGAAAGMRPVMLPHIYKFLCLGGTAEGGLAHRPGLSHKGDHRAVGGLSGVHIQHLHAFYGLNGGYNSVNHGFVPAFAVVGYTFDDFFHG